MVVYILSIVILYQHYSHSEDQSTYKPLSSIPSSLFCGAVDYMYLSMILHL